MNVLTGTDKRSITNFYMLSISMAKKLERVPNFQLQYA
jgi:hypothetical protein